EKMQQALALRTETPTEKEAKLKALLLVSESITAIEHHCNSYALYSWQQALPANKNKTDKCREQSAKLRIVKTRVDSVIAYSKDETALAKQLQEITKPGQAVAEADVVKVAGQWAALCATIEQRASSSEFAKTKDVTIA